MGSLDTPVLFVLTAIGAVLVAAAGNLFASELRSWSIWLTEKFVRDAVDRLPQESRERLDEEWHAFIDETPGQITKLVRAFGLLRGATRISSEADGTRSRVELWLSRYLGLIGRYVHIPMMRAQAFAASRLGNRYAPSLSIEQVEAVVDDLINGQTVISLDDWGRMNRSAVRMLFGMLRRLIRK